MFTVYVLCHVSHRYGVSNNHTFGIPDTYLPIHSTTFMRLRWRLRIVYRWKFYYRRFLLDNFQSLKMAVILVVLASAAYGYKKLQFLLQKVSFYVNPSRLDHFARKLVEESGLQCCFRKKLSKSQSSYISRIPTAPVPHWANCHQIWFGSRLGRHNQLF